MTDEEIQERLVALTRDLILIPSIPSRPEDIRRCCAFIKNHLEAIEGIEVREFEKDGNPSFIAAPKGCHEPEVLMCGHLDVITHPDLAAYQTSIQGNRIYGPGTGDMKGAIAILLEVFRAIHAARKSMSLGIVITSDEESGGEAGIGYLVKELGLKCGLAMIPDGGSLNKITIAEKGILHLRAKATGRTAHASRPWLGDNPITKLMRKLAKLEEYFRQFVKRDDTWYPTCTVTMVGTENQQVNRVPEEATAILDVRFTPPHTLSKMRHDIKEILYPELEVETIIGAEPTDLSPDPAFLKITEEVTGEKAELAKDDGGSDARFIAANGTPVIISRPLVGNLHATDEWIDIPSMVQLYRIYERFLIEKLGK